MRLLAVWAVVVTCAATTASAQSLSGQASQNGQNDEASALRLLNGAAFAPAPSAADGDLLGKVLDREAIEPGAGVVRWTTNEVQLSALTALRLSLGGVLRTPGSLPLNLSQAQYDTQAYEVSLTRAWPAAVAFDAHGLGVDVTPHAGLGLTNFGGSAEAGATLRLMQRDSAAERELKSLGIRDGASFGDKGRWYLFAAASGRAVGLNMLHGEQGWSRAGWSTDTTSTLTGDAQVGIGWRKGDLQTSFGYIHREIKGQNLLWGVDPKQDSLVALSLSIRPHF